MQPLYLQIALLVVVFVVFVRTIFSISPVRLSEVNGPALPRRPAKEQQPTPSGDAQFNPAWGAFDKSCKESQVYDSASESFGCNVLRKACLDHVRRSAAAFAAQAHFIHRCTEISHCFAELCNTPLSRNTAFIHDLLIDIAGPHHIA